MNTKQTTAPTRRRIARIAVIPLVIGLAGLASACQPVPGDCRGWKVTIVGTPGNDVINGTPGADVIVGLGGNDVINGLGSVDAICGGDGNDRIIGGEGYDTLDGEAGSDVIEGGPGRDHIFDSAGISTDVNRLVGGPDDDYLTGGPTHDIADYATSPNAVSANLGGTVWKIYGEGTDEIAGTIEGVIGSRFEDLLLGDVRHNTLDGGPGNDVIAGLGGDDRLTGGAGEDRVVFARSDGPVVADLGAGRATGNGTDVLSGFEHVDGSIFDDTLVGTKGANVIDGGQGVDTCRGGGGVDTFLRCP